MEEKIGEEEVLRRYNSVYLTILMRYKEYIEEKEGLSVAELPKLVTPEDSSVVALCKNITNNLPSYDYDRDFHRAAKLAYEHVSKSIATINLPVQFWQKTSETIGNMAGDAFDKAVLLCSMLITLGGISSKIIVAIKGEERSFIVYSEFKNKIMAMNIDKEIREFSSRKELLSELKIDGEDASAYEFNDKMYINIA